MSFSRTSLLSAIALTAVIPVVGQAQTTAQFVECYQFVASNFYGTDRYGGGDASNDFDSRRQSVLACQWVQDPSCVESQAGTQNYIFANRLQAAAQCQKKLAAPYSAVADEACYQFMSDHVSDPAQLDISRQVCVRYESVATPPPPSNPPVNLHLEACYNYPAEIIPSYINCLRADFNAVGAAEHLNLAACDDGIGAVFAPDFGECVRANFAKISQAIGKQLDACSNDTLHINSTFTTCVRDNFSEIETILRGSL